TMSATKADFYVSPAGRDTWSGALPAPKSDGSDGPFRTVAGAQKAVRGLRSKADKPVTVLIRGGRYRLSRPLVFTREDSGTADAPVTYAAYGDERPAFSGGRAITGWTEGKNGLWTADLPAGQVGKWAFNQLFVNGRRAVRARHPNEGYLRTAGLPPGVKSPHGVPRDHKTCGVLRFQPGDIKRFHNLEDVNIFLYHAWTASLHWIDKLDTRRHTVSFTAPSGWPLGTWEAEQRYVIENCLEALDMPGEWYLDRQAGRVYYLPLPGEDPNQSDIVAPVLEQLLVFKGNPDKEQYVQHVRLQGLAFEHADWQVAGRGRADGQAAVWLSGAVFGRGMLNCALEGCEIAHVGQYAVWLEQGCRDNVIRQCECHDMGAGGVKIGETATVTEAKLATAHNTVDNCYLHDGGNVFPAGVGVLVLRSSSNCVTHNEICDLYYTGVSVGWSWGYAPSSANQNLVEYNHIHHIGQGVLSDMGGIYTLGISPGTRLRYNLIHDVESHSYGGWGLYPDEGSTHMLLENNICFRCKTGGFHQHYGRENVIENNIFADATLMNVSRTREEAHASFTFERNIVYCTNPTVLGGSWKNNNYRMERNLYWNAQGSKLEFSGLTFAQWQSEGRDLESVVADPLFVDPENDDFRLKKGSPALKLGFHPIETAKIGLYGAKEWVERAKGGQ
ncbi:MAG: right-handed parallel beta-helix repeat-containing protein, partial [Armatimonadetes bacterium]|nr:right-handed parallel beta-helix repeat-containing protein [Armatimonadota bacterium]